MVCPLSSRDGNHDLIIALTSGLTNRLIMRVTSYYLNQIRLPTSSGATKVRRRSPSRTKRTWAEGEYRDAHVEREEAVPWLGKLLDSVRVRYRKIERYARYDFESQTSCYSLGLTIVVPFLCQGHCNCDSQIARSTVWTTSNSSYSSID
jgi:hypothetical protein